jgi:hypothetical protein
MTVLLGPNGSSKSKVFDVFAFPSATFPRGKRHQYRQTHEVLRSAFDWSGEHLHSYLIHGQKEIVATPQVRGLS